MNEYQDTIDLREILGTLRRGWRWIVGGAALGLVVAVAISFLLPPRYQAASAVLLRSGTEGPSLPLPGLGGGLGGLLPSSMQSGFDTELEVLTSRTGIESVIDSLNLQVRVLSPRSVPPGRLFEDAELERYLEVATYEFTRRGEGYEVDGPAASGQAIPGSPYALPGGVLTLSTGELPDEFRVQLLDMDEAVRRVTGALDAGNPGGDVAEVVFRAGDPVTAAEVPNRLVDFYMQRRQTTDRGVNQRRYEFLLQRVDSVQMQLTQAENELRAYQEMTGRFDPELFAEAELERATALRGELEAMTMEAQALERVIEAGREGDASPRALAAFPTFLRNDAINNLLTMLLEQEQERLELLERRTETDPEIVAFDQRILQLESQLVSLSSAYLNGLRQQQTEVRQELDQYRSALADVPRQAQGSLRLVRDVERLSEMSLVLHAQLLDARLDAISEGGDIRVIDPATPPNEPTFPRLPLNLLIGLFGGVFLGILGAFGKSALGEKVEHPRDVELAAGVPVVLFRPGAPLLLADVGERKGILVIHIGSGSSSDSVAEHLAATASLQGRSVAVVDLGDGEATVNGNGSSSEPAEESGSTGTTEALVPAAEHSNGYLVYRGHERDGWPDPASVRAAVHQLEQRFSLVINDVPALDHPLTTALLSPDRPVVLTLAMGGVTRSAVADAVQSLGRAGIQTAGVVLCSRGANGKHRS